MKQKKLLSNIFVIFIAFLAMTLLSTYSVNAYASPTPVDLLTAGNFSILSYAGISSASKTDVITGDIGVSPTTGASIGVTCAEITGKIYIVDALTAYAGGPGGTGDNTCAVDGVANGGVGKTYVDQAILDARAAITNANGRAIDNTDLTGIAASQCITGTCDLRGLTLTPGVYTFTGPGNVIITNDVTLSGNSTDVWIFIIPGTLDISSGKKVLRIGGAQSKNIFWSVAGNTQLQTTSTFEGTILGAGAVIAMLDGATLNGRAIAPVLGTAGAVTTTGISTVTLPTSSSDTTAPVITLFTLSESSISVGGVIIGTCTATDNLDLNPVTTITGIDTTTAGTKTATCTVTDAASNTNQSTLEYTVNNVQQVGSTSGGGSSGGGGGRYFPKASEETTTTLIELAPSYPSCKADADCIGAEVCEYAKNEYYKQCTLTTNPTEIKEINVVGQNDVTGQGLDQNNNGINSDDKDQITGEVISETSNIMGRSVSSVRVWFTDAGMWIYLLFN